MRRRTSHQVRLVVPPVLVIVSHRRGVRVAEDVEVLVVAEHHVRLEQILEERIAPGAHAAGDPRSSAHVQRVSEEVQTRTHRPERANRAFCRAFEPIVTDESRERPELERERRPTAATSRLRRLARAHTVAKVHPRVRHTSLGVEGAKETLAEVQGFVEEAAGVGGRERVSDGDARAVVSIKRGGVLPPPGSHPPRPAPRAGAPRARVAEGEDVRGE